MQAGLLHGELAELRLLWQLNPGAGDEPRATSHESRAASHEPSSSKEQLEGKRLDTRSFMQKKRNLPFV